VAVAREASVELLLLFGTLVVLVVSSMLFGFDSRDERKNLW
jgi:hypothetical protein